MYSGHSSDCHCAACITLPRIIEIVGEYSQSAAFVDRAGKILQKAETSLRDAASRLRKEPLNQETSPIAAGGGLQKENKGVAEESVSTPNKDPGFAAAGSKAEASSSQAPEQELRVKALPPQPPADLQPLRPVKRETLEGSPSAAKGPLADVRELSEPKTPREKRRLTKEKKKDRSVSNSLPRRRFTREKRSPN